MRKKRGVMVVVVVVVIVVFYNLGRSCVSVTVSQLFFAIFAGVLRVLLHNSVNVPFPIHYGDFSFVPSFQRPGQYSMRASVNPHTCPHNSHMLLSILSRIVLLPLFFTSFLTFNILDFLAARFKKSVTTMKIIIIIIINFPP
jgi:hypothetical protein